MKQTAVEWLEQKAKESFDLDLINYFKPAKKKEKQQKDDYAIEFFLWVKDNEKIIKKGKRITDKQLLEIFKNK